MYFDAKRVIKKIHSEAHQAIKHKDAKYINFLLSTKLPELDELLEKEKDGFSRYLLQKEIDKLRFFLINENKKIEAFNEQKSRKNNK